MNIENSNLEADKESRPRGLDLVWLASCGIVTALGAALRFALLGLKPLHHDEGVNGWFLTNLFRDGVYKYEPSNYHGPTLYYISLAFVEAFGLNTWAIRASTAIWGVITVMMAFFLRRYIGKTGALFAALFLALSPGMVFISRYFIHEMFFVFVGLAMVMAVLFFISRRRAGPFAMGWSVLLLLVCFLPSTLKLANSLGGTNSRSVWLFRGGFFIVECVLVFFVSRMLLSWNSGRPVYLLLAAACVALMFATKETGFITIGTMLIACLCILIWQKLYRPTSFESAGSEIDDGEITWAGFIEAFGTGSDRLLIVAAAVFVFVYVSVVFFSSFFTYSEGIGKAFEAYSFWTKTGNRDHTQNGTLAYLRWAMEAEAPILLLSAIGTLIAFYKARHRFAMFAALWGLGLFLAYTIIPYKTPWLALSFLLPMCLTAGYALNELVRDSNVWARYAGFTLGIGGAMLLAYQTYDLNFVRYDDEDTPYVYAHTRREFHDLIAEIELYAEKSGKGKAAVVQVVSPDYWPMVWYLRDYKGANFFGQMVGDANAEMIVAKKGAQDAEINRSFAAKYDFVGSYPLRSGVDLVLLVRKDITAKN